MEYLSFETVKQITFGGPSIKPCCELKRKAFYEYSASNYKQGDICKIWCSKHVRQLHEFCGIIKKIAFIPFLFVPGRDSTNKCHDLSDCPFDELTLEQLNLIETLEDVSEIAKNFANDQAFISEIVKIGTIADNKIFSIFKSLDWIKYADDTGTIQKFEHFAGYFGPFVEVFLTEYRYLISKVALEDFDLEEAFESHCCDSCKMQSERMKRRGNEEFAVQKFDVAATFYTKAIQLWPQNHLLYGNRALCFLHTGQYLKAVSDGKKAIILKPCWPKGHYRFCEALSLLGIHHKALESNERGQDLCKENPEGIKDLILQHEKLKKQTEEVRGVKQNKSRIKKQQSQNNSSKRAPVVNQESKKSDSHDHPFQHKQTNVAGNPQTKKNNDHPSVSTFGLKQRSQMDDSEKMKQQLNLKTDSQNVLNKRSIHCGSMHEMDVIPSLQMLRTNIKNGYTSLMDQCFHSAEQSFALLLNVLDPFQLQSLNLALVDYVVIIYGYASALVGIGQPEELSKAKDHFNKIEKYQKVRFGCLAHYGIGKVYMRQNRFSEALDQFMKSETMVNCKIVPGVLTWPTTSVVIEETRTEQLQDILKDCIAECKFPPKPDAVCRYQQCRAHKVKIYFSDPDFKGFIRVTCCQQCTVEFHLSCWKKVKAASYENKNDKDILQEICFTPDCGGLISKIIVFDSFGIIKCEFEHKIITKNPPSSVVKQKRPRILQVKQEKKIRRKVIKEAASLDLAELFPKSNTVSKDDSHKGNMPKNIYIEDTVLQLIQQYAVNIQEGVHDAFLLLNELLSWKVLSKEDYTLFSTRYVSSAEVMEQLISFLIAKNDRVKTRIFVHVLSELEEVDPKVQKWIKHLDNTGLKATEIFFSEYWISFLQLDFNLIARLWNEKYIIKLGRAFLCPSEDMIEILIYLGELSYFESRCLLWLLEENRQNFPFFHQYLDEYFDNMDNPFFILRKECTEAISKKPVKVKNKNRKKTKESKAVLVVSGGVGTVTRQEDNAFLEENTLSFMNPEEPFRIPDTLHEQVMMFETLHNNATSTNNYQRILDNYPDPTCESLYDYFSQILEEHGPLEIDSTLLVGEYEHFPAETRKIVEDAGGLKSFLLESLRFVMIEDLIGLMKHAVMLQDNANVTEVEEKTRNEVSYSVDLHSQEHNFQSKHRLNPAAKEFMPLSVINKSCIPISTNNLEYATTIHSLFSPSTLYSFSCHMSDIMTTSLLMAKLSEKHDEFLYGDPSVNERTSPMFTDALHFPDIPEEDESSYISANLDIDPSKDSDGKFAVIDKVLQNPNYISKSDNHVSEDNPDQITNHHNNNSEDASVTVLKAESKSLTRNNPCLRMIAVQVDQELTDMGINTLPFNPYETQQGDMLRMEKEHHVLQEKLKEASEKYELLKGRSSKETSVLEEELLLLVEGNKLSKRELDWFHQDLKMEIKRWQQEKKENQEGLKVIRNKVKKLTETNETYMKNIDGKDKQFKTYLDEFLEISNKFEYEKVKMEELTKKNHQCHQECIKRAIEAEVSVLENWKEIELYKLSRKSANAKANRKNLEFMTSHSELPQSKFQIDTWESLISGIEAEKKKVESQFQERICMIKNGVLLSGIAPMEMAGLQSPTDLSLTTLKTPPFNDPAIIMYSAAAPDLFTTFLNINDNHSMSSKVKSHNGNVTSYENSKPPTNKDIGQLPSEGRRNSLSDKVCLPRSPRNARRCIEDIQLPHSIQEPALATGLGHPVVLSKSLLSKPSENIIDHLKTIFPHHTSLDLENFIKEVKVKNKNKLSTDELLSRVTEFILDHPNKKKVPSSSGKNIKLSSCASGQNGSYSQNVSKSSEQSMFNLSKPRFANENKKKASHPPKSHQMPWKTLGETSTSKWKQSNDATDDDLCVICHEELTSELLHILDCGHRFHTLCIGPWIKEQSTCPTCRRHVLSQEDYPELSGQNRKT